MLPGQSLSPAATTAPAASYEARLKEVLGWRERGQDRLDYVLLTIDADGHTGGLFPGSPVLETESLFGTIGEGASERVVMTPALLRAARFVAVMVTGSEHREIITQLAAGEHRPIVDIAPVDGELKWYLDVSAVKEQPMGCDQG